MRMRSAEVSVVNAKGCQKWWLSTPTAAKRNTGSDLRFLLIIHERGNCHYDLFANQKYDMKDQRDHYDHTKLFNR